MNLFSVSSLILFFTSLSFGLFVYLGNSKSKTNRWWFLMSLFISIWGLSLYGVTSSQTLQQAIWWQYLLDISAIFIPVFYSFFILEFLGLHNSTYRNISLILALSLSFLSFSPLFKLGMTRIFDFYWVQSGPLYFLFPLFFVSCAVYSIRLLIKKYNSSKTDKIIRSQIKYQIIAGLIGFSGGITNFFPQLFNVYPFGNYFVIIYVAFISYSIVNHKLFNIKAVAAQIFGGAIVIVFLSNLLTSNTLSEWIFRTILFALSLVFSWFLIRSVMREVEQREYIEKLANDLAKINDELQRANTRLKELDKQKTEFVSIASHQLRSPLTAIKGYSSMLLEGSFGKLTGKTKEAVDVIFQSSQHLVSVIEDFLNITRIELGRMKYEFGDQDMKKMVETVMKEQEPNVKRKGLTMTLEADAGPHIVNVDIGKISQVISNIIDNSIKYTPKGSVALSVKRVPDPAGDRVRFTVKDTGVGIDAATLPKLFEKFVRAYDAGQTNIVGTGLGLYVAKQIVEGHPGGKLWAESEGKGKGSSFFLEFPDPHFAEAKAKKEEVSQFAQAI